MTGFQHGIRSTLIAFAEGLTSLKRKVMIGRAFEMFSLAGSL